MTSNFLINVWTVTGPRYELALSREGLDELLAAVDAGAALRIPRPNGDLVIVPPHSVDVIEVAEAGGAR